MVDLTAAPFIGTAAFGGAVMFSSAESLPSPFAATAAFGAAAMTGGAKIAPTPFASTAQFLNAIMYARLDPDTTASLRLMVYGFDGRHWDFSEAACSTMRMTATAPGGPAQLSWEVTFTPGVDHVPPDFARVEVETPNYGVIWRGLLVRPHLPDLADCATKISYQAVGMSLALQLRVFHQETKYGPRPGNRPIIALTAHDAITHAVSQISQGLIDVDDDHVGDPGLLLDETRDFFDQDALCVVDEISSFFAHIDTPFTWFVKPSGARSVFTWMPRPTVPRFHIWRSKGAKIGITRESMEVYNQFVMGWGNDQGVIWPETVSHDQIKIIHEKPVNVSGGLSNIGLARAAAQGLEARYAASDSGWRYQITLPVGGSTIDDIQAPDISEAPRPSFPHFLVAELVGEVVRIVDMDPSVLGPYHRVPDTHYITEASYDGKDLTLACGDPRGRQSEIRQVVATSSHLADAAASARVNFPMRDIDRVGLVGSQLTIINAGTDVKASAVGFAIPSVSKEYETITPDVTPPQPPAFGYQINTPRTTGLKFAIPVEPMVIEKFSLIATNPCNAVIRVTRVTNGGVVINEAKFNGQMQRLEVLMKPQITIERPDHLWIEVIEADTILLDPDTDWVEITFRSRRYYPGYPGNKAPKTGKQF